MSNHFDGTGIQLFEQSSFAESIPADHIKLFLDAASGQPAYRTPGGSNILLGASCVQLYDTTPNDSGGFNFDVSSGEALNCIDLELLCMIRGLATGISDSLYMWANGDLTATNYRNSYQYWDQVPTNSAAGAATPLVSFIPSNSSPSGAYAFLRIYIPQFRNTAFVRKAQATGTGKLAASTQFGNDVAWEYTNSDTGVAITNIKLRPDGYGTDTLNSSSRVVVRGWKT